MKLSSLAFANAAGTTAAMLWIVCALVAVVFPDLYKAGSDLLSLGNIGHFNLEFSTVVFGGVLFTLIAWVSGYLFGWNLGKFSGK